ncbi:hypothetical protein ACIA8K_16355 [Catenuloplanes sp. NPDC051500]|uniref:hypothetical protein n=1 Tax=Catenuloplanes sp. NPDC051500 TaxID=3363959 RepID=UPI0037B3FD05
MRAFESPGGALWQISRAGAVVTVRFTRPGAIPVEQAERYPSAALAAAHLKQSITHRQAGGYAARATPPASTEDVLVLPAPWKQRHHLRRGGWFTDAPPPDPATDVPTAPADGVRRVLGNPATPPDLAAAGLAALGDLSRVTPLGVAVVVSAAAASLPWHLRHAAVEEGARWACGHGPVTAAEAAVLLAGLISGDPVRRRTTADGFPQDEAVQGWPGHGWPDWSTDFSTGVRARLATAGDEETAAVTAALTPYRRAGLPLQRLVTSFLLPERQDWVDEDLALIAEVPVRCGVPLLLSSVRTAGQLEAVAAALHTPAVNWYGGMLPSLVEGVGVTAAPLLARWFDDRSLPVMARRRLAETLAGLPSAPALTALLDRADDRDARDAVRAAMTRYPGRAMRLAPLSSSGAVEELLRVHVMRFPELARAVLPELPDVAAARLRAILADAVDIREAGADGRFTSADAMEGESRGRVATEARGEPGSRGRRRGSACEPPPSVVAPPRTGRRTAEEPPSWEVSPTKRSALLPAWTDAVTLPRIALRDGSGVLPVSSATRLLTVFAGGGHPSDLDVLDRADLAEFGWIVFRRWEEAGMPAKHRWALTTLGDIGNGETVRRLAPIIRIWPAKGGHARAVTGLDVLASIGTDVALMHLHDISRTADFTALRRRAGERVALWGLTAEQLAELPCR